MNIKQFLSELYQQGVKFRVEGEELRVKAPKGVLTAETLDLLAKNKAELILLLEQKNVIATHTDLHSIKVVDRPQKLPLSFAQEQIWLLSQLEPDNPFYNELLALRLHGYLNILALEQSLNKVIARHEVLRTNFRAINEQPVQVIAESLTLNVPVVDLTQLPESEREIALQQLAKAEATRPFALASSPLIRASVFKLTEVEQVLLLTIHHIVFDGWSTGVLMGELASIYSALCNNSSPQLPALPIQYADFAIWQRQFFQTEVLQTQLNYWKQQLKNAPTLLELPTDRPRPAVQTFRGARQYIQLPTELSEALANFSRQERASLFMTLFTAYVTLLYRYTGSDDIVVGTPIANRNRAEIEGLIGFFVNTLVLRTDLSGNPSFQQLLSRVRQVTLEAYAHPDLPFEELVKALQPQRDLSHTPLFQVLFAFQNVPASGVEMTGLTYSQFAVEGATAKFDLTLSMQNSATGLIGMWEYNTDLFDASTIERMAGHFVTLLEAIVTNPQQQISQLPLLTEAEQRKLLIEWNDTQVEYSRDQCIHQLFEEQVELTPDAVAVVFGDRQLTYYELNCQANQLAHYLRTLGVKAEVLVGICVERSLEMVVGLLGILKAGGAYVPLDPEYPTERLHFMLEDAQVSVLLTQEHLIEKLPENQAKLVCLDTQWEAISQSSQDNLISDVQATNLAYVIYTSGSTGRPKGVMIEHQSLVNFTKAEITQWGINQKDHVLQFSSFSFDVFTKDIYPCLSVGGTLVLRTEQMLNSWFALIEGIERWQISILNVPAAYWHELVAELARTNKSLSPSLRLITIGGERLLPEKIKLWYEYIQQNADLYKLETSPQLINGYGPTETTIQATCCPLSAQMCDSALYSVPIGRPVPNTQIYILDSKLQPVPIGVPGELHIGGTGLARGYLNRPELTQEKFIPNPFKEAEGRRQEAGGSQLLYKTGDLVRYLPDRNIEYIGRIDNQVKIRGFRIELGEIETVLSQHGDVQASCVIAREDIPGDKRLVAYVVAHQNCTPTINDLRHFLKAKLPEYMVPNAIVILEYLPLTPNGKVDRRALPAPDLHSEPKDQYVAPRTPIEEMLAQIWAQVLKVEEVGIYNNFFELGGHSLLATQLISRISSIFQVELPLRSLFAAATVAELGHLIGQLQQQKLEVTSPPILPRAKDAELPLSYAQQRLWFLDQLQPGSGSYNMPLTLRLVGTLNQSALEQSLQEIIHRHEALRTNLITVDGQPIQVIREQGTLNREQGILSIVDLQHLSISEKEVATQQLAQKQAIEPFNLADEPLIRATLVVLSETENALLVFIHHIVSDGWSMGVFIQELATFYNAYSQGQQPLLAPLPIQYADFAIWQRNWLQGDVLQSQLSYWQQQLKDAPTFSSLPTDRPRGAVQTYHGAYQEFALSKELTVALKQLSQRESCTLFMTLLAAFQILLWRYSGQDDLCIGTPIANRNRAEIDGLIGFFVNTLVLRTRLDGNPSFKQLLSRVREVALGAYSHQDLPFEILVEALQPERNLSHNPIFQVWFNLMNLAESQPELFGLSVEPISIPETASKFDLSLYVAEHEQGIILKLVYNTDLFNADTISRMLLHYQTLLESIVANPEQKISRLPLLIDTELYSLKTRGNVYPSNPFIEFRQQDIEQSIPARFQEQVRKYPHNIAVHTKNYHWTYSELNYRANQVAQVILKQCTLKEERIALLFEHDAPMIAGILGVLKVGKTYIPLDPSYPSDRINYILEDSKAIALLTNNHNLARAQKLTRGIISVINIDDIVFTDSDNEVNLEISLDTISYILYTSGSTGQPKGVIQSHRNVLYFIKSYTNNLHISEQDGLTLLSSYSFDAAIVDIFSAILNGATLYPINIKEEGFKYLFEVLQQQKITIYHSTPTLYRHFIKTLGEDEKLNQIRLVVLGGEEVVKTDVDLYKEHFSNECIFVNCIGSTESSITMLYLLNRQTEITRNTVPVGYPVEETEILLLNEFGEQTDIYGEIAIRSPYVALGYWHKPDLTQAVFLPDLESTSRRIYRTGDLGCLRADGSIEFLGRKDFQVKIRGFRIELGEIEAVIAQHPSVRETVVIASADVSSDKHLAAYVVPTQTVTAEEIRYLLRQTLPEYMIPASWAFLDSLPLTPNRKIDRRALPAASPINNLGKFVEPRNQIELQLVQIWSKILKVDKVGVQDNFFDLGGHSLLAPYLMAQIKQQFGKEIPLASLFQNPTVEQLATIVEVDSDSSNSSCLVPIQPTGSNLPFFCVPGAGGEPFYLYHLGRYLGVEQPLYSFQPNNLDREFEPATKIRDMASHYIQAMHAVQPQSPYFLGGHSFGGKVAFEMAQQLLDQGHEVALLVIIDTTAPTPNERQTRLDCLVWDHTRWLTDLVKTVEVAMATNMDISEDTLRSLPVEEQLKYVLQLFKTVNILPPNAEITQLKNLLQAYKTNSLSLIDYVPKQIYPGQITLLRASEPLGDNYARKLPDEMLQDSALGWNEFAGKPVKVDFLPGNHVTMMAEPHIQVLAERLKAYIKEAQADI